MSIVIICPNAMEHATSSALRARGYLLSNARGRKRMLVVAHRVPVLTNVVRLRPSIVEQIFEFAGRPQ